MGHDGASTPFFALLLPSLTPPPHKSASYLESSVTRTQAVAVAGEERFCDGLGDHAKPFDCTRSLSLVQRGIPPESTWRSHNKCDMLEESSMA
jgi:hypothetical protein